MSDLKMNLRQKLVEVYRRVDHVEKAGHNEKQRYWFVRAADVLRAIRNAFADLGIYAETNYDLLGTYDIKTNSGGIMHTATVKATIKLHDADSDETMTISGLGDGADGGDKGIFKAQTGATKNALRNGALLPDEADPEADESVDRAVDNQIPEYNDFRGTSAVPDFQDTRTTATHRPTQAPAAQAKNDIAKTGPSQPAQSAETQPSSVVDAAAAPSTTSAAPAAEPEHGDAYEGPDDALPTEEELTAYRSQFKRLGDDLAATGKLKASRGLPINRKLLVFLLSVTKATEAAQITRAQWDDFFARVEKAKATEGVGFVGITALVNKANGLEEKK